MKIKVTCFGHLAIYHASSEYVEVDKGLAAKDLPRILGFSAKDVAMYFIGEQRVDPEYKLSSEDVIKIFPPITGG